MDLGCCCSAVGEEAVSAVKGFPGFLPWLYNPNSLVTTRYLKLVRFMTGPDGWLRRTVEYDPYFGVLSHELLEDSCIGMIRESVLDNSSGQYHLTQNGPTGAACVDFRFENIGLHPHQSTDTTAEVVTISTTDGFVLTDQLSNPTTLEAQMGMADEMLGKIDLGVWGPYSGDGDPAAGYLSGAFGFGFSTPAGYPVRADYLMIVPAFSPSRVGISRDGSGLLPRSQRLAYPYGGPVLGQVVQEVQIMLKKSRISRSGGIPCESIEPWDLHYATPQTPYYGRQSRSPGIYVFDVPPVNFNGRIGWEGMPLPPGQPCP